MPQPVRKTDGIRKNTSKKPKKTIKCDVRLNVRNNVKQKRKWRPFKSGKNHPAYGTSKLEERFARDFLDRLGLKYIYQYKMESIGRYLDYMVVDNIEHPYIRVAIEVDGDWFHSYGLTYEQMNPMQKRNRRVDEVKNEWCARNGIPLIRIWESDINNKPDEVLRMLREKLGGLIDNKDKRIKPKIKKGDK